MSDKPIRPFETRYWFDARERRPMSSGFPKAEEGSINGASKAVGRGYASKVQCIDRASGNVVWTVKALPKIRGINIRPTQVFKGDPDSRPRRRKE